MQKRNILNSPRLLELKMKRRRAFLGKAFLLVFVFGLLFSGLVYISRTHVFNIQGVEIKGALVVDVDAVKKIVEEKISGNYLWFFPKTDILFYPKNEIKKEILGQYTRVKSVDLTVSKDKILVVSLSERDAVYTWCGDASSVVGAPSEEKCYFTDADGYIFDIAPYFSDGVYLKLYGKGSVGEYFLKDGLKQLIDFKDNLASLGFKAVSIAVTDDGDVKYFLSISGKEQTKSYITFKIDSDFAKVLENLKVAISTDPLKIELKNKLTSLLYIDLRFGNKVYYKFD